VIFCCFTACELNKFMLFIIGFGFLFPPTKTYHYIEPCFPL
jgi:hypothetical protein